MSEPLRTGDNVKIVADGVDAKFYEVTSIEPFNYETGTSTTAEFTSVASGSKSGFKNITVLEPDDTPKRLFQVWPGVKDGMTYFFKIPTGTSRWGTDVDKNVARFDNLKAPDYAKNELYEFWLVSDFYPSIDASNATGAAATPVVFFEGWKYGIKLLPAKPLVFRTIKIGGLEAG